MFDRDKDSVDFDVQASMINETVTLDTMNKSNFTYDYGDTETTQRNTNINRRTIQSVKD